MPSHPISFVLDKHDDIVQTLANNNHKRNQGSIQQRQDTLDNSNEFTESDDQADISQTSDPHETNWVLIGKKHNVVHILI